MKTKTDLTVDVVRLHRFRAAGMLMNHISSKYFSQKMVLMMINWTKDYKQEFTIGIQGRIAEILVLMRDVAFYANNVPYSHKSDPCWILRKMQESWLKFKHHSNDLCPKKHSIRVRHYYPTTLSCTPVTGRWRKAVINKTLSWLLMMLPTRVMRFRV